jgi:hypothetical protein
MMATFIAQRIIAQADISLEAGQAKYRAYFVKTKLYASYQDEVNSILETTDSAKYPSGYGECIVTA